MTDEEWKKHWREIVTAAANAEIEPDKFGMLCWDAGAPWRRPKARAELLKLAEENGWKRPTN